MISLKRIIFWNGGSMFVYKWLILVVITVLYACVIVTSITIYGAYVYDSKVLFGSHISNVMDIK
jgi:hypothetical protein